ncbi:MAG TPA: cytochrome C biogenesis protein [Hyphomonadaceae bacterium]|nr:cytochrome C biogenesis protein [Hyphomonadaceae bacterium]
MDALNPALAYLAGALSILSPCVLPLVPIVLGTAGASHRLAPLALAGGLALSFTAVGVFVATVGFAIGIESELVRRVGGAALSLIGVVLLTPSAQAKFAHAAGPLSTWAQERMTGFEASGLSGQAGLGLLLGVVWSPCVGPTLGAASLLAAQGRNLEEVAFVMLAFGVGAASVMLALGYVSAGVLKKLRSRMRESGAVGRTALGGALVVLGLLIVTGGDRVLEAWLVDASPEWLTSLTTRY